MSRLLPRRAALLVLMGVALVGVNAEADGFARRAAARQSARVGREVKLKVGRSTTFGREDLRLRFASAANDSRCPTGVTCVWAGNAEVLVEVSKKGGGGKKTLRLNTNAGPERPAEGKYGRYTVKLVGLSPYPSTAGKIKQGEYAAALLVTKD
jgi:hypothetical protein